MAQSNVREYISNASAQTLGRAFSMGSAFAVFVMVARFMGSEELGRYAYMMVFWGVAITAAEFGTNSVLARELALNRDNGPLFLGNFIILRMIFNIVTMAIALPAAWYLRPDIFPYLAAGIVALPFLGARFFEPVFQIYERPWFSLWLSSGYSLVYLILSVFVLLWRPALATVTAAYIAANVVYVMIAFTLSSRVTALRFSIDRDIVRSVLRLSIPIGISGILTIVHMRADTFMLASMKGDAEVGLYNAAYKFLDMALILAVMVSSPFLPIFSRDAACREKLKKNFASVTEIISAVILPVAVVTPFISNDLMTLFYGKEFAVAAPALNVMAWIGVMTFYSMLNYTVLVAIEVVAFQIWLTALSAVMNVALNLLFIPVYGFTGSAWATFLTEIILAGVSFLYVQKSLGNVVYIKKWIMIVAANLFLFIFLVLDLFDDTVITVAVGLAAYLLLSVSSGILPFSAAYLKKRAA